MQKISEKIREALLAHTDTLREIGRQTEIDVAQLSRFANEQPGGKLGQDTLDKLAAYLGLELRATNKKRKG